MIKFMRERLNKDEGFTLVELMVVVLIIAILIAIAIPTFLGARERAQDRGLQSNLRNALTAEKVYYTDAEHFALDNMAAQVAPYTDGAQVLTDIEPSLTFVDSFIVAATVAGDVHVTWVAAAANGQDQIVCLEGLSQSGTSFAIMDIATGTQAGTYYNSDDVAGASLACHANTGVAPGGTWTQGGW